MLSIRVLPRRGATLRAALATLEIMTVLVAAHTWAGGELPVGRLDRPPPRASSSRRARSRSAGRVPLWALVPALTLTQLFLHSWLVVLAPAPHTGHAARSRTSSSPGRWCWPTSAARLATALIWELRRRAVEVVLTWADAGLLPVPALRRTRSRTSRRCCRCGARSSSYPFVDRRSRCSQPDPTLASPTTKEPHAYSTYCRAPRRSHRSRTAGHCGRAAPASAHVTITPSDTAAGAYTVLTVSVGHGCEGSPTTALDIQIPEQILSVTPTLLPGLGGREADGPARRTPRGRPRQLDHRAGRPGRLHGRPAARRRLPGRHGAVAAAAGDAGRDPRRSRWSRSVRRARPAGPRSRPRARAPTSSSTPRRR